MTATTRIRRDSSGSHEVPAAALWGAQTQRAINNFPPSGLQMPRAFIRALALIKHPAAGANAELADLAAGISKAIQESALKVAAGDYDDQFPIDVFQTGSGTSSNMNANEVIATLAGRALGRDVHPNDDVNASQSSHDTFPTTIHVAATEAVVTDVIPALRHLADTIEGRAAEWADVVTAGRTHLMAAVP